jgi:colicin import membrane protein
MLKKTYKWPFVFALLLHGILFSFLFVEFTTYHNYTETNKPQVNIIKATAVDQAQIEKQISNIKTEREHKQQEELARIHRLQKAKLEKIRQEQQLQKQKELVQLKKRQQQEQHRKNLLALKQQKLKLEKETKRRKEIQKAMQQQIVEEQRQMAEHDRQVQAEIDKYKALIIQTISQHWIVPSDVAKNISCQLIVNVAPGGEILSVNLTRSSGNSILDRSARSAVLKSSPLPVPKNAELFDNFRQLMLTVRPEGIEG